MKRVVYVPDIMQEGRSFTIPDFPFDVRVISVNIFHYEVPRGLATVKFAF